MSRRNSLQFRSLAPIQPGQRPVEREPGKAPRGPPRVTTACKACKKRKSKCDGPESQPCMQCRRLQTDCEFEQESDGRRRVAYKRSREEVDKYRQFIDDLFTVVRVCPPEESDEILDSIRQAAPFDEIKTMVETSLNEAHAETSDLSPVSTHTEPNLGQLSIQEQSATSRKRRNIGIHRLSDTPLVQVPASPWTTITDDNDFVSHLISNYATWINPFFGSGLGQRALVRDMQAQELGCDFCSPFLVNAILAETCTYSLYPEACAVSADRSTRGDHFFAEAKRLLDLEDGRVRLTNAQGLLLLAMRSSENGKDRLGAMYLSQATYMARQLGLFYEKPKYTISPSDAVTTMRHSLDATAWAIYQYDLLLALTSRRSSSNHCMLDSAPQSADHGTDQWIPYPSHEPAKPAQSLPFRKHSRILAHLGHEIIDTLQETRTFQESTASMMAHHDKLKAWHDALPESFEPDLGPPPHVLVLLTVYHSLIITAFFALPSDCWPTLDAAGSNTSLRQICISAALAITRIATIYQRLFSLERTLFCLTVGINLAMFVLLEDIAVPASQAAFEQLLSMAMTISRSCLTAKGVLKMISNTVDQSDTILLPQVQAKFDAFNLDWAKNNSSRQFSSQTVNIAEARRRGLDDLDELSMDYLLSAHEMGSPMMGIQGG